MGTITANVDDDTEQTFRTHVYATYGKRKGSIGRALTEAMTQWAQQKTYFDTCMKLLREGINMGKMQYKTRTELHERN